MAKILLFSERLRLAEEIASLARHSVKIFKDAIELEESLKQDERGLDLSFAKTQLDGLIVGSEADYTIIDNENHINLLSTAAGAANTWAVTISPSFAADLTSFSIDNVASPPTITANGGSPFDAGVFAVGDIVEITSAQNPAHNGRATITIITTSVMTLTAGDMPGTGNITSTDLNATITLLER